jgi:hypothetical protein
LKSNIQIKAYCHNTQIRGPLDLTICARDGTLVCFGNLSTYKCALFDYIVDYFYYWYLNISFVNYLQKMKSELRKIYGFNLLDLVYEKIIIPSNKCFRFRHSKFPEINECFGILLNGEYTLWNKRFESIELVLKHILSSRKITDNHCILNSLSYVTYEAKSEVASHFSPTLSFLKHKFIMNIVFNLENKLQKCRMQIRSLQNTRLNYHTSKEKRNLSIYKENKNNISKKRRKLKQDHTSLTSLSQTIKLPDIRIKCNKKKLEKCNSKIQPKVRDTSKPIGSGSKEFDTIKKVNMVEVSPTKAKTTENADSETEEDNEDELIVAEYLAKKMPSMQQSTGNNYNKFEIIQEFCPFRQTWYNVSLI